MMLPDIRADARRAFDVLRSGGIALFPIDTGYALMGATKAAIEKIHAVKQRGPHKSNAMVCDPANQREIHVLSPDRHQMIRAITDDYDLPLGIVAPFDPGHPMVRRIDPDILAGNTIGGTLAIGLNSGVFYEELARLSTEHQLPLLGSSANLTGTGVKYRLEHVQKPLRDVADIEIDHGLSKFHLYRRSSTMIDFHRMEVIRIGVCYELIADVLRRHFDVDLPPDPGVDVLPSGNLREQTLGFTATSRVA